MPHRLPALRHPLPAAWLALALSGCASNPPHDQVLFSGTIISVKVQGPTLKSLSDAPGSARQARRAVGPPPTYLVTVRTREGQLRQVISDVPVGHLNCVMVLGPAGLTFDAQLPLEPQNATLQRANDCPAA